MMVSYYGVGLLNFLAFVSHCLVAASIFISYFSFIIDALPSLLFFGALGKYFFMFTARALAT